MLSDFSELSQDATQTILAALSTALDLRPTSRFEIHHLSSEKSDTGLKLIYEPALSKLSDVPENKHTDSGTLTLTFTENWGIHVQSPSTGTWGFPEPKKGTVLVNIADSLQRLSGGKLHSPVHRVTQRGDGEETRIFLAYFLRPSISLKESWSKDDSKLTQ